jgi:hypothetical protein
MAEVIQGGAAAATRAGRVAYGRGNGENVDEKLRRELAEGGERRARSATWSSSLCQSDLACLLTVIETQVLPRLLREYRPADRSPLKASCSD